MTVTDEDGNKVVGELPDVRVPQLIPTLLEKLEDYSNNLKRLSIHRLENNLRAFDAPRDTRDLYRIHPTQHPFLLQFDRDPQTGKVLSYKEVETSGVGETSKNSLSLTRAHGSVKESVKGNSTNLPFWPGGFDEERSSYSKLFTSNVEDYLDDSEISESLFKEDLLQSPPGLPTVRLEFDASNSVKVAADSSLIPLEDEGQSIEFWETRNKRASEKLETDSQLKVAKKESGFKKLLREIPDDIFIPPEGVQDEVSVPVLRISRGTKKSSLQSLQWAEQIDVTKPMLDFQEKVPDMAFKYPFKLDTFQQQAIAKLEEHENVFVAAHTSAGKTVVAEYAIALSVRHMTRTVYTSPIKALSNQKFRDFKNNFESVGLITGDVQINSTASCLIMTTEILRSMLYNGSDVIRDLEWVIFDEIHYLNNEERGHVWEEVLIMLPQHVSIIMLSATVPNALHFANWVGEIKKKKIYVITTPKRPVPLEHHLYTGCGGKSRNEQFLILDGSGDFKKKGYDDAKEAKNSRQSKHQQSYGPKGNNRGNVFNENTEKTLYVGLVSHLKENDKLPVVVFTFSRNKCDTYAKLLSSVDLCTGAQKAEIHGFFQKSISRLKGSDKELPQVLTVRDMLKNGVGIHHSGILPILKEVVEMLFQKGLVKLLFATETFAMGVNMPARTVVFDSIRKHDGTQFRNLNPAEYIQMAGRAGRRGLDTTGNVIILCKNGVPDMGELKAMMLGNAAKLESQFRLTYSMILNLLRVESLSVEDVMKRSFLEAGTRALKMDDIKKKLSAVKEKLEELDFEPRIQELTDFYSHVKEYLQIRDAMTGPLFASTKIIKELLPGRVVIFENLPSYSPRLGIILSSSQTKHGEVQLKKFKVLTLKSEMDKTKSGDPKIKISNMPNIELLEGHGTPDVLDRKFRLFLYFAHKELIEFCPDPPETGVYPAHAILEITAENILEIIIDCSIKMDSTIVFRIEEDVSKRNQPRFKNEPPGQTIMERLQFLHNVTVEILNHQYFPELFRPLAERLQLKSLEIEQQRAVRELDAKWMCLKTINFFESYGNFLEQFRETFLYMRLVDEKNRLEYLLSPKSLRLHEEYQARIRVLQELDFIDGENLVQLKGRVACEMGNQNELMMTEMIFRNILSDCPPMEVAALLSCMVFEAKNVPEPKLSPDSRLKKKVDEIKALACELGNIQRSVGNSADNFVEQFKFGLVEVVYEWAQGKPFADIMTLTEVQEGLIVRTIQRLDELLKDVKDAARIIGDPTTKKKMEEASECIKRDIVFAASLYTQ